MSLSLDSPFCLGSFVIATKRLECTTQISKPLKLYVSFFVLEMYKINALIP